MVRLGVYGCVLVIALLVWQVRAHHSPEGPAKPKEGPNGTPLSGRTLGQGGSPLTVLARGDRPQTVSLTVRWPCADMPWDTPAPMSLENELGDGGRFRATRKAEFQVDANGWQAVLTASVEGQLTGDRATGTLTTSIAWMRNGVAGQACQPRTQRWEAARP